MNKHNKTETELQIHRTNRWLPEGRGAGDERKREEMQRSNRKATVYYLTYYISIMNKNLQQSGIIKQQKIKLFMEIGKNTTMH